MRLTFGALINVRTQLICSQNTQLACQAITVTVTWPVLPECTWTGNDCTTENWCTKRDVARTALQSAVWYWWQQVRLYHSTGLSCYYISQYTYLYSYLANVAIWLSIPPYFNCLSHWESFEKKGAEAIQSAHCQQYVCLSQRQRPRGFAMSEHSGPEWH